MRHELKVMPIWFERLLDGSKTFEIRKNDRNYQCGDELILCEWKPTLPLILQGAGVFTGRRLQATVGVVLSGVVYGLNLGEYVVMSLLDVDLPSDEHESSNGDHELPGMESSNVDHLHCPTHGKPFSGIQRTPNGNRICPEGDVWRVVGGQLVSADTLGKPDWRKAEVKFNQDTLRVLDELVNPPVDSWRAIAARMRDILRQLPDAVNAAGLTADLVKIESRYRNLAETQKFTDTEE
jgi:hypothetical protein